MRKQTLKQVADLKPAQYNPRNISKAQLEALGRAMREFGDLGCIVVNIRTGHVVGGHQRLKHIDPKTPIKKSPHTDASGTVALGYIETPAGIIKYREVDWPIEKEKAANLAANKHGGEFNIDGVRSILFELNGKFDLDLTGFLPDERFLIFGDDKEIKDVDDAPAVPAKPKAKIGELYRLGDHVILCGDAAKKDDWAMLMGLSQAAMIYTDPPCGVAYTGTTSKAWERIDNDEKPGDALLGLIAPALKAAVKYSTATAAFYVWHASSTREDFAAALKAAGLSERQYLIWAKPSIGFGHSDYQWAHEPCFYAAKAGQKPDFYGDRSQPTVWRVNFTSRQAITTVIGPGLVLVDGKGAALYIQTKTPRGKKLRQIRLEGKQTAYMGSDDESVSDVWEVGREHGYQHPTQKPVELARRAMINSSRAGDIVVDCFLGSGSTLIAAEITGRRCYGMELDPKYVDVEIERWEKFTGRKAVKD